MKKRIDTIDILKGITIILVVFGHAVQGIVDSNKLSLSTEYSSIFITKSVIYSFHMPVFFMISGFFLTKWIKNDRVLALKQKFRRLVYPYFIWSFITAMFMQLASSFTNNGLGLIDFLKSPIVPFSQYWFLYLLFFFHLVYFVSDKILRDQSIKFLFIISILLFCFGLFLPNFWVVSDFSKYFLFFITGSYLLPYIKKITNVNQMQLIAICIMFVTVNCINLVLLNTKYIIYYFFLVTSAVGFLFLFAISIYISQKSLILKKFLSYVGKNSMQIYVMHLIPVAGFRIILQKAMPSINPWGLIFLLTILSLILCLIGIKAINKLKLQKILF